MTVEYIASDKKRSKYYSQMMDKLGIKRVGFSNYWMKQVPSELDTQLQFKNKAKANLYPQNAQDVGKWR